MEITHDYLLQIVIRKKEDYRDFGETEYTDVGDCSCDCYYFLDLLSDDLSDWGVCVNPKSHRCGLLTFEHQGCKQFVAA